VFKFKCVEQENQGQLVVRDVLGTETPGRPKAREKKVRSGVNMLIPVPEPTSREQCNLNHLIDRE
jgi:hypothetical protein